MQLTGWGRFPVVEANTYAPRGVDALREIVLTAPNVIARGNGRAYGDSAINPTATIEMRHLNRMLAFDDQAGQLIAEPGVLLGDVIAAFLPRGWFPAVTPGTKFVTLGGAIAADVHGKNHHKDGSFRTCVDWLDVMDANGDIIRCSREQNIPLFEHTLGGMGLTGIIVRAAIRLRHVETAWINQTTVPASNLKAVMALFEAQHEIAYSAAWIDCHATGNNLGRSLVMLGQHAKLSELPDDRKANPFTTPHKRRLCVPYDCPSITLNRVTVRAFNALYYWAGTRKTGARLVDWDSYFYPLDAIGDWNRIYGSKGFMQFQCVLPLATSEAGLAALLRAAAKTGSGSFLAVLKRFGQQDSPFSFPMAGYTLALDFPVTPKTLALLDELDQITLTHGGRFYLAKDSRMTAQTLHKSDARVSDFIQARKSSGSLQRFCSTQSERLSL